MTPSERVEYIIATLCGGTAQVFCDRTKISKSQVSKIRSSENSGQYGIGPYAERIARGFPEIDCRWLLTGEGEPLGKGQTGRIKAELRALRKSLDELAERVEKGS